MSSPLAKFFVTFKSFAYVFSDFFHWIGCLASLAHCNLLSSEPKPVWVFLLLLLLYHGLFIKKTPSKGSEEMQPTFFFLYHLTGCPFLTEEIVYNSRD